MKILEIEQMRRARRQLEQSEERLTSEAALKELADSLTFKAAAYRR